MNQPQTIGHARADLEHERAARLAARHRQEQLAMLAAQAPDHRISLESYPGRPDRFVAQAIRPDAHPYLVVTANADELAAALGGTPGSGPAVTGAPAAQRWLAIANANRLRGLRRQRGLSQAELAGRAGVSVSAIARLEQRPGAACRGRTLARLAAALGADPADLSVAGRTTGE